MILDKILGPLAAFTSIAALLAVAYGCVQHSEVKTLQVTLKAERAQHKAASDQAAAANKSAEKNAETAQAAINEKSQQELRHAEEIIAKERMLAAAAKRLRDADSRYAAATDSNAEIKRNLERATTYADAASSCGELSKQGVRDIEELITVLANDRAAGFKLRVQAETARAEKARCEQQIRDLNAANQPK